MGEELETERLKCMESGIKLGSLETNACPLKVSSHSMGTGPTCQDTWPKGGPRAEGAAVLCPPW